MSHESDEEFAKSLQEATQGSQASTMSDEDYARTLQEELNSEPTRTTATNQFYPQASSYSMGGTYAAPPPGIQSCGESVLMKFKGQSFGNPPLVPLQSEFSYEAPSIIAPSAELALFMDLKRRAFTIKILCVIDFVFAIYGLTFNKMYWMAAGLIFPMLGFWGANKFNRTLIMLYMFYLAVDMLIQLIFSIVIGNGFLIALTLLIVAIQLFIIYYVYQFYKKLPRDGLRAFSDVLPTTTGDYQLDAR